MTPEYIREQNFRVFAWWSVVLVLKIFGTVALVGFWRHYKKVRIFFLFEIYNYHSRKFFTDNINLIYRFFCRQKTQSL